MDKCNWIDGKIKPCPSGFQHYVELGKPYFGKDIQRGHTAKFCPFCGVNIVDEPLHKLKWEISGEHNRNHHIKGEDGNYAILVYRVDARDSKKMSREIKLRAWDKENKIYMVADNVSLAITFGGKISEITWLDEDDNPDCGWRGTAHSEGKFILEQYTGETDKNKIEYCEGDTAMLTNAVLSPPCKNIHEKIDITAEVKYISGGFFFWNKEGCCEPIGMKPMSWEIIGNIHEEIKN